MSEDPLKVTIEDVKPLVACRGCLVTDQRLWILKDQLADAFSMFISAVGENDIYPKYICMYCRHLLLRFVSFRNKCLRIQTDLTKIASMSIPITMDLIKSNYRPYHLALTETLLCCLEDENISIQNTEQIETLNMIEQNLFKNEPNESQAKQEDKIEVEILPDILDDEVMSLSDDDNEDYSDISEDTDFLDCLGGINSDVYKKNTKKDYSKECKQVKPPIAKQQLKKTDTVLNVDMIVEHTENPSCETLSKNPVSHKKRPLKNASIGKVDKHVIKRRSVLSVKRMKMWIERVKSIRLNSINDEQPPNSDNRYHEVSNDAVNASLDKNSTQDDRKHGDLNLNEIRSFIDSLRVRQTNHATKILTIKQRCFKEKLKQRIDFEKKFNLKIVKISKAKQMQNMIKRKDTDGYKNSKHKCGLCYTGLKTKITYMNHMARHEPVKGKKSMCDLCKKYFPIKRLRSHLLDYHKYNYICNICGHISLGRHPAKLHYQWHQGIKYDCKICGKCFNKPTSVLGHMHLSHKDVMVKCSICSHQCIGDKGLNSHMILSHKEAIGAVCPSCGVQFHSVSAMQRHRPHSDCDHTHRPCTACGEGFSSDVLFKQHQSQCQILQRVNYRCKMNQLRSIKVRTRGVNFVCEICGCIKNSAIQLDAHRRRKHTGETNYNCDHCGKGYFAKHLLQCHIMSTHMGMRPFCCKYCNRQFTNPTNQYRHENTVHVRGRPHKCHVCGDTFKDPTAMRTHIKHLHEGVPWPKRVRNRQ